jgi:hypothetical protein
MFLNRYGGQFGALQEICGKVVFVAPSATYTLAGQSYSADNANDGLSPERAVLTVNQAVALCTADVGDAICLLSGSHSWAVTQTISKAGLKILGIPGGPVNSADKGTRTTRFETAVTTTLATGAVFTVTAARVEIAYLHITPIISGTGIALSAASDVNVHNCTWSIITAAATDTIGISVTGICLRPRIANQFVYVADNQGPFLRCASSTGGMDGGTFQSSLVVLTGSTAWDDVIEITTGVQNFSVRDIDFNNSTGAVMTDILDVTGNTTDDAVSMVRCYFNGIGNDPTEATATSDVVLNMCFLGTIQGGTGGAVTGT